MKSSDWEKRKDSWTLMFIKKKSNIISIGKNNSTFISRKFSKWKKQQKFFFFSNFNTIFRSTKKAIIPYTQLKKDSNFAMFSLIFIEEQSNWIITQNYLQKRFQAKKISLWWGQKSFPKHLFRHNKDKMEAQSDIVNVVWLFFTYFCNYATDWR